MSQDIDRLIDSAFEHDRERIPAGATRAPQALLQKAALPVAATGAGVLTATWFKLMLGVAGLGAVITYFALQPSGRTSLLPAGPQPSQQAILDSPVIQRDSIVPAQKHRPSASPNRQPTASPSPAAPPTLMPPIIDSGVKIADSIRAKRRRR